MKKSIMGPPLHVALISPGETETEDVFVQRSPSHAKRKKTHTHTLIFPNRIGLFFCFSRFRTDQQTCFYAKRCSVRTGNIPEKYSSAGGGFF